MFQSDERDCYSDYECGLGDSQMMTQSFVTVLLLLQSSMDYCFPRQQLQRSDVIQSYVVDDEVLKHGLQDYATRETDVP
jgi:hypothetical protein